MKESVKANLENYIFVAPAVAIFSIFYIIPFICVFWYSFLEWDGIMPITGSSMIWLSNFKEIFSDSVWWQSIRQAGYITFVALVFQNTLAFLLAWACNREMRMKNFYRVIFFIPPILSEVVVGQVWKWILDGNYGVLNYWLTNIGFTSMVKDWLSDPKTALSTLAVVHCWKGFGWGFLLFLAGLQTIPRELYEAARVDGANAWKSFKSITMPIMMPVIVMVMILTVLGTMQIFALIYTMTGGGPGYHTEVPVTRIFASLRGSSRFGYACAQGITFGIMLCAVSFAQYMVSKKVKA